MANGRRGFPRGSKGWIWPLMALGVPALFGTALFAIDDLVVRRTLRTQADTLVVEITRFGFGEPRRFPLAQLRIEPMVTEGARGWTNTGLVIHVEPAAGPQRIEVFQLPGGTSLRDRAEVLAHLEWTLATLRTAIERARRLPAASEDPDQRGALEAIRGSSAARSRGDQEPP